MAGKRIIASLRELAAAVKAGKPISQSIVRRVQVKGKDVYTREAFKTPLCR